MCMWLESHQLNTLPAYQSELNTIAVVLVQTTEHAPIHMQQINLLEVLMEFLPDVDLCQFCEVLIDIEHWMGTSYHIHCEILDVEDLWAARAKPWALPSQDVEWVKPHSKKILPLMVSVERIHMYNEEIAKLGEPFLTPTSYHQVPPPI